MFVLYGGGDLVLCSCWLISHCNVDTMTQDWLQQIIKCYRCEIGRADTQTIIPTSTRPLVRTCLHLRFPTQLWAALRSGLSPAALQSAERLRPTRGQSVPTWVVASQPSQPDHCPAQPADGERSIISVTALLLGLSYKDYTLIIAVIISVIISVITHMC